MQDITIQGARPGALMIIHYLLEEQKPFRVEVERDGWIAELTIRPVGMESQRPKRTSAETKGQPG